MENYKFLHHEATELILQGLGVGPGSVTERWPWRKTARKSVFFSRKSKITFKKIFFKDIPSSYAKYWGEIYFSHRSFSEVGEKQDA